MEPIHPTQFSRLQELIYANSGIRLDDRKVTLLTSRLKRRLRATGIEDAESYLKLVTSRDGRLELSRLLDAVTTNETSFFRTESHFIWFAETLIPELVEERNRRRRPASLKVWSAACANGAEPYSIAFCLHQCRHRLAGWDTKIFASDLSESSIEEAREGRFRGRMIDNLSPEHRKKYFTADDENPATLIVREPFRSMVEFQTHNLMEPLNVEEQFDCVFLRNVLIYFDEASKRRVLDNLLRNIVDGGYLVVGPSEGVYGMHRPLLKLSTFLYQKEVSSDDQ